MGIISSFRKKTAASRHEKAAPVSTPAAPKGSATRTGYSAVIVQPYLSEKSLAAETRGVYTFIVAQNATKHAIFYAVETLYGVRPTAIRVVNVEGKHVRFGRSLGRRSDFKKAIVTLPKGKTISIHEGV